MPPPPVGIAAAPGAVEGVSTGTCAAENDSPPLRAGADTAGGVANGGGACGSGADPGPIACIAPSDNDWTPAVAGCPVIMPVATDCPIGPGEKPCPTAAGERGPLGVAGTVGAIGTPTAGTGGLLRRRRGWWSSWHRSSAARPASPYTEQPAPAGTSACETSATATTSPPVAPAAGRRRRAAARGQPRAAATTRPDQCHLPNARGESRSSLLIGRGGGTSSVLKPCSRAQVRASPWIPSASRIFCVAAMILLTAAPDALAASALHRAWIAWISANCSGSGFFEARTSSISLLPSFAISVNRLRR